MPPELRKRKVSTVETPTAATVKKSKQIKTLRGITESKIVPKVTKTKPKSPSEAPIKKAAGANLKSANSKVKVGETLSLDGFGGEIETNEGVTTTLQELVDESTAGVVLFTYPKASTPGCTTQACLFRDQYKSLTASGFSIYGLSKDSPKSNSNFKTKQKLPYPLLCDPNASLITAIGLRKPPSGTTRGVFVIDKTGKVLATEPGGPAATVEVAKRIIEQGTSERLSASDEEDESE
ncbi:BgTH12-00659 [Blumeria graminis f. sp. triticale]|uniref:thioredoxin-dependent peroxiredoxin n=3 Tax=Blumeria graminis TaxID=34373 RepID=A0A381L6R2_BLUGR|nr:Nuclear thiol peroxidase [Blumeria graminis f. sp. tritici 96224]CAD6505164.1 BgTH12-00659 [Blumeria graminis f. sp. triticale]VDB93169.1 Bgt-3929 [Blumeria graminis f. sp. tritici]